MDIKKLSKESWEFARAIIESIDDGIFITDGEGRVIEANKTALGIQKREDILGKTMKELVEDGTYDHSVSLMVIESGEKVSELQHDETEILVTGIPYIENEEIKFIVCCERELKELEIMKQQLEQNRKELAEYKNELAHLHEKRKFTENIIMESREMKKATQLALTASKYDSRVLIEGETGVGKEVLAKLIHQAGSRKEGPFIAINCGAIPETLLESELFGYEKGAFTGASSQGKKGYFELANKGVLLMDEIETISPNFQAKLLRAIQENEIIRVGGEKTITIDVQIIATSNVSLSEMVREGKFRADLFYRLNTFPITVPPLRTRRKDIVPLVYVFEENFNKKYGTKKKFDLSSLNALQKYDWPGNVRELENVIERLILTSNGDIITNEDVRSLFGKELFSINPTDKATSLKDVVEKVEKEFITMALNEYKSPEEIEKALDISRATLNRKIKKYKLR